MPAERLVTWIVAVGMLSAACGGSATAPPHTLPRGATPPPVVRDASNALAEFDACEAFLDYVIENALDLVGPYGLGQPPWMGFGPLDATAAEGWSSRSGSTSFSTTNVQVAGVDEPDIVKTDGHRIVVISEGNLIVVDVTGAEPVETGRLELSSFEVQSMFLYGDRVLLLGSVWSHGPVPLADSDLGFAPIPASPTVQIVEVDISIAPRVERTMTIDGALLTGRMADGSVRVVLTSGPVGFEWSVPSGSGLRAERRAIEENRDIVRNSSEENWIPYFVMTDSEGDVVDEGTLFDCDRARHPAEFSGLDMLSVLTIDITDGLSIVDATGVLATGQTIYSSGDRLYVATQDWAMWRWLESPRVDDRAEGARTEIHVFDTSSPIATEYSASGSVEGFLLNQFAMDEHDGMLRVASTTSPNWWGAGFDSESRVTVLRRIGDSLIRIGQVDGLGKTEQIYAVRFMGDVGYVVTFRQTDPLYTLDLSDPRSPRLMGELKIPGYSSYLHPLSDGLVMGIGQDATENGQVEGAQVSVFDVSDLSDPRRVETFTLDRGSSSQVEYDHHAFLLWEDLALIPIEQWLWDGRGDEALMGVLGLRVGDDGRLTELAMITHPAGGTGDWDWRAQILRSVVVEGAVYTISAKGIMKSSLDDLEELAWLGF